MAGKLQHNTNTHFISEHLQTASGSPRMLCTVRVHVGLAFYDVLQFNMRATMVSA